MTLVPGPMASVPAEAIDVVAERERTAAVLDGPDRSHPLNSAGAALPTKAGVAAVIDHLLLEARIGGYEAAAAALPRLDAVYVAAAALIGAQPTDIALVESATVGWRRIVDALRLGPGDRVVATRSTYVSSALQLLELERSGVVIDLVPEDPATGATDLDALDAALALPAALLAATHVPTSSGLVEPVAEIGARARAAGVTYLLDATQSVGQLPVDVGTIGCDALVTTGRKFLRAPRGTGFLYLSPELCARLRPTSPDVRGARWVGERSFELGATARRFESWEAAHALRLGLGVALAETAALGVDRIARHAVELGALLRARLAAEVDGIRIADPEQAASGIVTFVRDGEDPRDTLAQLTAAGCNVVVVPAAHGLWDLSPRGYEAVVRASVHVYNGEDDVDAVVAALTAGPRPGAGAAPAPRRVARPSRSAEADVVVVGGGVHGRSAAWQLARRGRSVTLLEQFRLGHDAGSSHGRTRMIRRAYPSPVWDGLVDRAYGAWADLEAASGTTLLTTTGGLFARAREADGGLRGPGCELLDAAAARRIAPALTLGDEYAVLHDPAAGVLDAPAALDALAALAVEAGAELREAAPVASFEEDEDGVTVHTPGGTLRAGHLVVCAGPWSGALLPELAPVLDVVRIVNVHLASADPAAVAPPALGVFSIDVPDVGLLYGIPAFGGHGLKVGLDHGPPDDPRRPPAPVTAEEIEALTTLVRRFLPAGDGPVQDAIACRYTMAPRNRFAIGPLPGRPRVLAAAACSGHAFKFGPAIGAALADLVDGIARPDLAFLAPSELLTPA